MFDFENHFNETADLAEENEVLEEATPPDWENAEWEQVVNDPQHQAEGDRRADEAAAKEDRLNRWRAERKTSLREKVLIDAIWYMLIAVGFGVLSIWLKGNWQTTAIILSAVLGMISTYGFGMARALRRK